MSVKRSIGRAAVVVFAATDELEAMWSKLVRTGD